MPPTLDELEKRVRVLEISIAQQGPLLDSINNKIDQLAVLDKTMVQFMEREQTSQQNDRTVWQRIDNIASMVDTLRIAQAEFSGSIKTLFRMFAILTPILVFVLTCVSGAAVMIYKDVQDLKRDNDRHESTILGFGRRLNDLDHKAIGITPLRGDE